MFRLQIRAALAGSAGFLAVHGVVEAGGVPTATSWLEEVVVTGRLDRLSGTPISASAGVVTSEQLDLRPVLRTGELLEVVPGLIVTQHSGDGKANQYFLRGFNLDHGTDLSTRVDGVPVNMPTHAHGQGYTDINFVIPELIDSIEYRKGTYYADGGDFSAAGAVNMRYRDALAAPLALVEAGENGYARGLLAASPGLGAGDLLFAVEHTQSDGPWLLEQHLRKTNALLRYSQESSQSRLALTLQGYEGAWRSTDQIPLRAVRSVALDRYGFVDPTDGGESHRYGVSVDWAAQTSSGQWRALAYALDYELDLFSNFTYAIDQEQSDQFEQLDERRVYGASGSWRRPFVWRSRPSELELGFETRRDDIDQVGLYRTSARERIGAIREDAVVQSSYSLYASVATTWSDYVRTSLGLRADRFQFDVTSALPENSGQTSDSIVSPKLAVVLGPWRETEVFLNVGQGFHSNDARGATIRVDPTDGATPATPVDPLVSAFGADIGVRTAVLDDVQLSLSLWRLDLDSELVFVGDAGLTEASRASTRSGVELGAIWNPLDWLIVDADLAWSRARFDDDDPAGDRIPGAVESVASLGVALDHPSGWFGGARLRHFGAAPLIEDGSVESSETTLVNVEAGYRFNEKLKLSAAVFNVFGSDDNDITYFYESQLPGESAPVADLHFHPVEPRTVRVTLTGSF
jgi:outer membrane cobalamin receptor